MLNYLQFYYIINLVNYLNKKKKIKFKKKKK